MKFILEINNKTKQKFSKKFFVHIFRQTLELAKIECLKNKTLELSIAIVSEKEIETLNTRYRKKNSATDVLSFCEYEKANDLCVEKSEQVFIGELILCPEYIACNAKEDGETFEYALKYITAHGILHLLGFNHGKKMFDLQKIVANSLGE